MKQDLPVFFSGELNPVASKAQKKVPIPEGLDLDAWINEPMQSQSESSEDETINDNEVFVKSSGRKLGLVGAALLYTLHSSSKFNWARYRYA